jgi:H+/gluconate symporter-like permease
MPGRFGEGTKAAGAGSLLASMNTASECGFGGVIAALPGFIVVKDALTSILNPLVNQANRVTTLAGITVSGLFCALPLLRMLSRPSIQRACQSAEALQGSTLRRIGIL